MNNLEQLSSKNIQRVYLETVYWWVDCEDGFHRTFKNIDKDNLPYDQFYAFTKKYSVRRTLKEVGEKQVATDLLLTKLKDDFIDRAMSGDTSCVDCFKSFKGNTIISLLSKFATLINPKDFTMFDTQARTSLQLIMNKSKPYETYKNFLDEFNVYKKSFIKTLDQKEVNFHLSLLYEKHNINKTDLTRTIFKNRLADKFLWVLSQK